MANETKVTKAEKGAMAQNEADNFEGSEESFFDNGPFPILSRAAAIILGHTRYYTGSPCKNGHFSPRKVKSSTCVECSRIKLRARTKERLANDPNFKAAQSAKAKARRLAKKELKGIPAKQQ
jgi:hypothetical protein